MRLLFLNHNVSGTGTYQRVSNLARECAVAGHDVTVVTTSRRRRLRADERSADGVCTIEAPDLLPGAARNGWDPWNAVWRSRRLAAERFDVVHAFDCRPAVLVPALLQRRRTAVPVIMDWADWWGRGGTIVERSSWPVRTLFGPFETWLEESFRAGAAANTTISRALRDRCVQLGVPASRVAVLPNGCRPPDRSAAGRRAARARLGIAAATPLVLHLGVAQRADAALLFDAFAHLLERLPHARLALVGSFRAPVPQAVARNVIRAGWVGDDVLRMWLAAADAGAIPLRDTVASRGRWPGKVNEYLSAGVPAVLPHVGDAAAAVARAAAGITCAPDARSFATALERVLADGAERARLAANARSLAAGPLAWPAVASRLLALYEQWLDPAAAPRGQVTSIRAGVS